MKTIALLAALLTLLVLSSSFQCDREVDPMPLSYDFAEKLTLTPYKKTYMLGDTIWVSYGSTAKTLYDKLSNTRVSYDTTRLSTNLYYRPIWLRDTGLVLAQPIVPSGLTSSFGASSATANSLFFATACQDGFGFRVGFVPQRRGVFVLMPSGAVPNCPAKRQYRNVRFGWSFDLADSNLDVFQSSPVLPTGSDRNMIEEGIRTKTYFAFKVD